MIARTSILGPTMSLSDETGPRGALRFIPNRATQAPADINLLVTHADPAVGIGGDVKSTNLLRISDRGESLDFVLIDVLREILHTHSDTGVGK